MASWLNMPGVATPRSAWLVVHARTPKLTSTIMVTPL
jgi:hypothetical protein